MHDHSGKAPNERTQRHPLDTGIRRYDEGFSIDRHRETTPALFALQANRFGSPAQIKASKYQSASGAGSCSNGSVAIIPSSVIPAHAGIHPPPETPDPAAMETGFRRHDGHHLPEIAIKPDRTLSRTTIQKEQE